MKILIVHRGIIPVVDYGGTERVIWDLGHALAQLGHRIIYLVKPGSFCDFGKIIAINDNVTLESQIPNDVDLVHFHCGFDLSKVTKPYVFTMHGNSYFPTKMVKNSIFVSKNHAKRYQSQCYVSNGLNWDNYSNFTQNAKKKHFHFLGKANWKVKNVRGAIEIIRKTKKEKLKILGGSRNIKHGLLNNIHHRISFEGYVGGVDKDQFLNHSKGLIFPVRWHEPFGLAIIESLYYGGAIFGTNYGSLPEIVTPEVGFLSNNVNDISKILENDFLFSSKKCHDYAVDNFNHKIMANKYLSYYEQVLNGISLNEKSPILISNNDSKLLPWN